MNLLAELRQRFLQALTPLDSNPQPWLDLIRRSQDAQFGDYQANCAMPLAKKLGKPPREIASALVANLQVDDLCQSVEIAGPGFLNLKLRDDWLSNVLTDAVRDERLGVQKVAAPRKYVIDYSGPNVAKPMHVGHIRSTVIGDSLCRTLRFLGHEVISDNHLGDWGTQFGMMLFGYKHFLDVAAYKTNPVQELARLYRLVRQLVDYHAGVAERPKLVAKLSQREQDLRILAATKPADAAAAKAHTKDVKKLESQVAATREELEELDGKLAKISGNPQLAKLAAEYPTIGKLVLEETAKLHAGDAENRALWMEFLPPCLVEIQHLYERLNVTFDHSLGESYFHEFLPQVTADLEAKQLARISNGALCVFLEGFETPFLIRKQDGAFLYATTDLATLRWRVENWQPDAILYVVDTRQSQHFEQLFATARLWGYANLELQHIAFGTVLGPDGKPYKTRAGDTVGLESLLDEAETRALEIVKEKSPDLPADIHKKVSEVVGIASIKYADLSHNRVSDYAFKLEQMVSFEGNTAAYMQYAYVRVQSIFRRGEVDIAALRQTATVQLKEPAERALAIELLGFSEALERVAFDYRPNQLTDYLWSLSKAYSGFFEQCHVLNATDPAVRNSRLLLCDLTARTIRQGLELLGIQVVEKM